MKHIRIGHNRGPEWGARESGLMVPSRRRLLTGAAVAAAAAALAPPAEAGGFLLNSFAFSTPTYTPTGSISFLGSTPVTNVINGGGITLSFSNLRDASNSTPTLASGDLVVVVYACASPGGRDLAVSSTGWTREFNQVGGTSGVQSCSTLAVFTKFMGGTPDTSCVFVAQTGSTVSNSGVAFAFRGVNSTTYLDASTVTAIGAGNARPDPAAITPTAASGSWILVTGCTATQTASATLNNPGDLSATTNHFRSVTGATESNRSSLAMGLKTDWTTGAFDPAQWTSGTANTTDSWTAATLALRAA